jgi:hypothetical protein
MASAGVVEALDELGAHVISERPANYILGTTNNYRGQVNESGSCMKVGNVTDVFGHKLVPE